MPNPGKVFEQDFQTSFKNYPHISIDRIYDAMGFRKNVANISDFIVYRYPSLFYFECKSVKGTYFGFSSLSEKQYTGLISKARLKGVTAGILINFRSVPATYFIPIEVVAHRLMSGEKGINVKECEAVGTLLFYRKKRTRYSYTIPDFLRALEVSYG